jgi:hypothetical protein
MGEDGLVRCRVPVLGLMVMVVVCVGVGRGQSTFGNIVGTVTDSGSAAIPGATVVLINKGSSARRTEKTNGVGEYSFNILDAGDYEVTVDATGFEKADFAELHLLARETKRVDASLKVGSDVQTVEVSLASVEVITTDTSSLATTKTGEQLVDLPVAIYAHSNGSTSPISTLTTNPGVQTDDSGNLVIAGATPALISITLDGISCVDVENSGPIDELFPSFNSISEIRVSETNNNAEYSGVADITTTSRAGTNKYHGGIFENHENTALNAGDPFQGSKTKIIMNDFGGFVGGPVTIPGLYRGKDKTFFFASFEGLRLPRETPLVMSVPSLAMRAGNVVTYLNAPGQNPGDPNVTAPIYNYDGTPLDPTSLPVSATAAATMNALYPLPNKGDPDSFQNNYAVNFPAPISSNQGDLRLDENFTSKQSAFARVTYKSRSVVTAPDPACVGFCVTSGSPLTGGFAQPEVDAGVTLAHTYLLSSNMINEFRAGFNLTKLDTSLNVNSGAVLAATGIQGVNNPDPVAAVPNMVINGFMVSGGGNPSKQRSKVIQLLDNLTLTHGTHTMKFGLDFRRLSDHDDNVFGNQRSGQYDFNGTSDVGAKIDGYTYNTYIDPTDPTQDQQNTITFPFVQFLLGYPDYTVLADVVNPNMDGVGYAYAGFAQDDWKATPKLTFNFGFRYELHPPLKEIHYDTAAFDSNFVGDGTNGAVVVPNAQALTYTDPLFAQSIAPTPILTAAQDHLPEKLRYTALGDYGPRVGFAWRPFAKTVIRGGWGRFIESPLGFSLVSGWSVSASFVPYYYNDFDPVSGAPLLSFPSPFPADRSTPGAASFYYAFPIHYKDPSVQQWNLTYERDLGFRTGLRVSYTGSHGANLETMEDLNQVPANTVGYYDTGTPGQPGYVQGAGDLRPFQDWQVLQSVYNAAVSNYNALSVVVEKQTGNGLSFQSSYVFTRDLSNEGGAAPSSLVGAGGNFLTDRFHPRLDYGNVVFDRKHRFLTTALYDLPFGKNKKFLAGGGGFVNGLVGGWQVGSVFIWQSGPFLTPYEETDDPAGTNMVNVVGFTRPDRVSGQPLYTHGTQDGNPLLLNAAAFALPGYNIGRFGNSAVGSVVGPGTVALASSIVKGVSLTEGLTLQVGISAANVLNHRNYEPPNMELDTSSYGETSELQSAEGTGPRTVQLTARISF